MTEDIAEYMVRPFEKADLDRLCRDVGDVFGGEHFFRSRWDIGVFSKNFIVSEHSYLVRVPTVDPQHRGRRFIYCVDGNCCEIFRRNHQEVLAKVIPFGLHPLGYSISAERGAAQALEAFHRDLQKLPDFVVAKVEWEVK